MTRYVLRRLAHGLVVLFLVSVGTFLLAELAPGDFLSEIRLDPRISDQTLHALRSRYGLDQPLPVRYLRWLQSIAAGEFGHSFAHDVPVGSLLWPRARNTLFLATVAMALTWLIAVPLGAWAAWHRVAVGRGGWLDRLVQGAAAIPLAVPDVVIGLGCLLLAAKTGLFPIGGMTSLDVADLGPWARIADLAWHLALPAGALTLAHLPALLRHVRAALADTLESPFLRSARGHGIPRRRLLFRYALPAAAHPLTNLFGLSVARLLSGSLLIEVILSWPGMGPLLLEAILARDLHVVIGATLMSCGLLIAGNLAADVLLFAADPRIRLPEAAP